jgi:flagellar hook-associated protein 1
LGKLDTFASTLASEFNKIYSQGFGATGFSTITSLDRVSAPGAPLDEAGLDLTPTNGSFHIVLRNTVEPSHPTKTTTINVNLLGLDGDSSLSSIASQINAIDGVTATVTSDNKLRITADSPQTEIAVVDDQTHPSGLPAALGINTFFTGTSAATLGVNPILQQDSTKFAAALDGIGVENDNAIRLVELYDQGLGSLGGNTIIDAFDQLVTDTTQGATVARSVKDGFDVFKQTLEANASAISGVNLDEEAVDLILLQRTYQASAKYIATVAELLDVLVNL